MERFGYQRLGDFLEAYRDGNELNSAFAYLHRDDEIQTDRLVYAVTKAIVQAFGDGKKQKNKLVDDDEEIIDTTDPKFVEQFKGFSGIPGRRSR